ncbi:SIR2 family NAD-dependent protein deacylase [Capnocytophaga stomatis]|uniref:NAD-dependent protein deacylase n=1 Tax=Capnocytophaga stomatis TaxID=1848904 RepID=A0ABW8Q8I8_9FLAO|nr:NAD-dependent deacylase [Capnocytophaga stomatis]GIJ93038.1 NAD-dependent protein deacylase [Capnocytophaga stomatis]
MKKIVALTGAGISAESGIKTFRDSDGLWEGHNVMEVASPEGFAKNPNLVLDFYNQRRRQLKEVKPNLAHTVLAELQSDYKVVVVTQNVDDLHERAGSKNVIHLHGELLKSRGVDNEELIFDCFKDIHLGDLSPSGAQLRPHIVWFGESVPMIPKAIKEVETADILLIIGTSLQVYPAAGLMDYARYSTQIYYVDLNPQIQSKGNLTVIKEKASVGMQKVANLLRKHQ